MAMVPALFCLMLGLFGTLIGAIIVAAYFKIDMSARR